MIICAYVGRSKVSRMIQLFSRVGWDGPSHIAIDTEGAGIYEAWYIGGVRRIEHLGQGHTPGTLVHRYHWPMSDEQRELAVRYLQSQVGKGYDFAGVFGFLSLRRRDKRADQLFCSEYAINCGHACGSLLLDAPGHHVMPAQVLWCPRLRRLPSVVTTNDPDLMVPAPHPEWARA